MKNLLFSIVSMILVITLAGCNNAEQTSEPAKTDPPDEIQTTDSDIVEAPKTTTEEIIEIITEQESVEKTKVYVSAKWVNSVIQGKQPQSQDFVILEASWGEPGNEYLSKHIPGAVHITTDAVEEEINWNIRTPEEITELMKQYGITNNTTVIIYGNDSGAERVAFTMLWAGVEEVHILNGGLAAWEWEGFDMESGNVLPVPTEKYFGATIPVHPEYIISTPEDVLEAQKNPNFRLVSIRSWKEFIGKVSGYSYIERKGEPLGAVWGHDEFDYYNENRMIKNLSVIEEDLWQEWNISEENEISFYCGTGWRACIPFLICYENGWENITLFDGGWYVWQMDEELPVQIGDPRE